jgi:hypothetical protein
MTQGFAARMVEAVISLRPLSSTFRILRGRVTSLYGLSCQSGTDYAGAGPLPEIGKSTLIDARLGRSR